MNQDCMLPNCCIPVYVQTLWQRGRCDVCSTHAIKHTRHWSVSPCTSQDLEQKILPILCWTTTCDAADAAVTTATAKQLSTDSQQAALQIMMPDSFQHCRGHFCVFPSPFFSTIGQAHPSGKRRRKLHVGSVLISTIGPQLLSQVRDL